MLRVYACYVCFACSSRLNDYNKQDEHHARNVRFLARFFEDEYNKHPEIYV